MSDTPAHLKGACIMDAATRIAMLQESKQMPTHEFDLTAEVLRLRDERDALHAEIRDLNDALTAANQRMAAEIQRAERERVEKAQALADVEVLRDAVTKAYREATQATVDANAAQAKLREFKAAPFIHRSSYDIAVEARDAALANVDALASELATLRDRRHTVNATRALDMLERVMATLRKDTADPKDERVRAEARAMLVEMGRRAPEVEAMRSHSEQWLASKGQR